jgi:glycosidase
MDGRKLARREVSRPGHLRISCWHIYPEGTWRAAADKLELLKSNGITSLEMMPISDFPGRFGWGYDGVDCLRRRTSTERRTTCAQFIDRAHALGLGVILDVVYNHFGPDGNYLGVYSDDYMNRERETNGAIRSISMGKIAGQSANSSSPMDATGSRNFISTVFGSMQPKHS